MAYFRREPPKDPALLPGFLRQELERIQAELSSAQELLRVSQSNVAPDKPRQGDVRYADGTNWDPLSDGTEQYVWFDGSAWKAFGTIGASSASVYDTGGYYLGAPGASTVMMRHVFVRAVSFPANMANSKASAGTAATAATDFDLKKNGSSFGTMRFAAGATTCSFVGVSATTFAVSDVLTVVSPASPDATLADIAWMFAGTRGAGEPITVDVGVGSLALTGNAPTVTA